MLFEFVSIDGAAVITLRVVSVTRANCDRIRKAIAGVVDFRLALILDLGAVKDVDLAGLSLIVHWLSESRRMGGAIVLCSESPNVLTLIELVGISAFSRLCSSLKEALDVCYRVADQREQELSSDLVPAGRAAAVGGL